MSQPELNFLKKYAPPILFIVVILLTVSFMWFSRNQQISVQESLRTAATILRNSDNIGELVNITRSINNIRVTIIDERGTIIADNTLDGTVELCRADRPEFIAAQKSGYGEAIRKSESTGKNTIYVIAKLKSGNYVRLAQSIELTRDFLLWLFAPIIFLGSCLTVLMFVFAKNRQIEKMRQEFVANVSHELKTPLTSIKGYADLTTTGLVSDIDSVKEFQRKIVEQSDRLLVTIEDILQLSKIENTKPQNLVAVDMRSVSEQVRDTLKFIADEKNIIIQVSGAGSITAEVEPIYQMIYNIVDNSIKYGKNGGFVKIFIDGKKISITDNGIGIPQKDLNRVFERFYRVDKSRSVKTGGTGLGLAIVKHTVQKYGGVVSIKSDTNGTQITAEFKW